MYLFFLITSAPPAEHHKSKYSKFLTYLPFIRSISKSMVVLNILERGHCPPALMLVSPSRNFENRYRGIFWKGVIAVGLCALSVLLVRFFFIIIIRKICIDSVTVVWMERPASHWCGFWRAVVGLESVWRFL
uniref:Uncharacterized protein n=1 Tax=Cacopsylla melanoneura TaxID=428564 RepID=A0A8D8ZAE9_9HEMI